MKKIAMMGAALALVMSMQLSAYAESGWIEGVVVGVTDGDTATILDADNRQYDVRMFAIDAPETSCHHKKPSHYDDICVEKGQPFGKTAKKNLSKLIYGKQVSVRLGQGASYGRVVGTIYIGDQDVNLQQVIDGYAWHERRYAKDQTPSERQRYSDAESNAKSSRYGFWSDANPIPPWEYRRQN